jgi:hypothetical protein
VLHFEFNFFYVDGFGFGIQSARDFGFLSRELADGILFVEAIDGFPGRKDEFASQILDAVERTGCGGSAHGLGLEHLLVGTGERVYVEGALAVGNLTPKDLLNLLVTFAPGLGGDRPERKSRSTPDRNSIHSNS